MNVIQEFAYKYLNKVVKTTENSESDFYILQKPYFVTRKLSQKDQKDIIDILDKYITSQLNLSKTFYKSWEIVIEKERSGERFLEQLLHYFTTYGLELQGDNVYYPEDDTVRYIVENTRVIECITIGDFIEEYDKLLKMNIAQEDIDLFVKVYKILNEEYGYEVSIDDIQNKELKIRFIEKFGLYPDNPQEFLRYIYYVLTDDTLYINKYIEFNSFDYFSIKKKKVLEAFKKYEKRHSIRKLAEIFNRNKKFFISLKQYPELKTMINKISKLSKKYHIPKGIPSYLKVTSGEVSIGEFKEIIKEMDTSYLIKLANAFKYRIEVYLTFKEKYPFIYKIRNGKIWYEEKDKVFGIQIDNLEEYVLPLFKEIRERIQRNIYKKKIVLKNYDNFSIDLAVPTSGKKFVGNIPFGSSVVFGIYGVVGIYWENKGNERYDLDLSGNSSFRRIGWDSGWSYGDEEVIYSGDVTDAKNGACELLKFQNVNDIYTINVNLFKGDPNHWFKLFIANVNEDYKPEKNVMVDSKDIVFSTKINLNEMDKNSIVGIVNKKQFIFGKFNIGNSRVANINPENMMKAFDIETKAYLKFSGLDLQSYEPKDENEEGVIVFDFNEPDKKTLLEMVE